MSGLRQRPQAASATPSRTEPNQHTAPSSNLPSAIRNARILVIGAGPVGLFASSLLKTHNVSAHIVERLPSDYIFTSTRTYTFALNNRGQNVLRDNLQSALDHLQKLRSCKQAYRFVFLSADGQCTYPTVESVFPGRSPGMLFLRPIFAEGFEQFAERQGVTISHSTKVTRVEFSNDSIRVHFVCDDVPDVLEVDLVLACDGSNSTIVRELQRAAEETDVVTSSAGFENVRWKENPPSGRTLASFIFSADIYQRIAGAPTSNDTHWMRATGGGADLMVMPMRDEDITRVGGVLANVGAPPEHPLWTMDLDHAFEFFEREFPAFRVRESVSLESMQAFVSDRRLVTPDIRKTESLVACVGRSAGVVLLGDAAHSMPPSMGQAMNAGLEDVAVFMRVLTSVPADTSLHDILREFERVRRPDVTALCELATFASQRFHTCGWFEKWVSNLDVRARTRLAKWFPKVFFPTTTAMFAFGWPYSVILRRHRYMSTVLVALAFVLGTIAFGIFGVVVLRVRQLGFNV